MTLSIYIDLTKMTKLSLIFNLYLKKNDLRRMM